MAAVAFVGVGAAAALWPLIDQMNPDASVLAAGGPVDLDVSKIKPGQQVVVQWRAKPIFVINRPPKALQTLLMRELQHRGCNLLAVVQSIAQRTLSGKHYDEAGEAFEARLQALARCYKYFGQGKDVA